MKIAEKIFVIFVAIVVALVIGVITYVAFGAPTSFWWGFGLTLGGTGLILTICFVLTKRTSLKRR